MAARRLILLGSTGSIGVSTVQVLEHLRAQGTAFEVIGLAAGSNATLLAEQAKALGVHELAIADANAASALGPHARVRTGPDAALRLVEEIARPGDVLVAAMVGFAGLASAMRAIELGCHVALANKETLVAAGALVTDIARRKGVELFPIDSEHSALAQCIRSGRVSELDRVVITASGGPFRTWSAERTATATVAMNVPRASNVQCASSLPRNSRFLPPWFSATVWTTTWLNRSPKIVTSYSSQPLSVRACH